jgi:hypothetical protein
MQNRARVEAARRSVDFSRENLDAEQKKYDLGASTNTLVLQAQRDLSQSESVLIGALTAYEKARVDLDRAVGRTLTKMNINLADAQAGTVQTPPTIDNVMPRKEVSPEPNTVTPQPNPNESGPTTNPQATTQPQ